MISRASNIFSSPCSLLAACALAILAVSPSMADITFAQYDQFNGAAQQWSIATSGDLTTVTASGTAEFTFSGVSGLPFSGPELANFSLSATSSQLGSCGDVNCPNGDSYTQPGYIGTCLLYTSPSPR